MAESFDWVQSVDRLKVLTRLNRQRPANKPPLKVLLQLKLGEESTKSGASEEDLYIMYQAAKNMPHVVVKGIMCIPPASQDYPSQCDYFKKARTVFDALKAEDDEIEVLSMGMSGDLEAAVASGSTLVRIGTDIFGART